MRKNGIIILHDIQLQFNEKYNKNPNFQSTNDHLFTYIRGEKILPTVKDRIPNIGAIILSDDQQLYHFDYFFALTSRWTFLPQEKEYNLTKAFMRKYYDRSYVEIFEKAFKLNKSYIKRFNERQKALKNKNEVAKGQGKQSNNKVKDVHKSNDKRTKDL